MRVTLFSHVNQLSDVAATLGKLPVGGDLNIHFVFSSFPQVPLSPMGA